MSSLFSDLPEALKNNFNLAKQSLQVAEKQLLRSRQFSFSNNEINCIILVPAAVVVGSGNVCPIIKSVFKL